MPPKKRKLMPPAPTGKCRLLLEERYKEIPVDAEDLLNGHVVLKFMQESKLFAPTTKFFAEHMGLQITKNKIQLLVNRTIKKYTHMNREKEVSMLIANCDEKYKHEKKQQEPGTSAEQAVRRKLTQTTSLVTVTPSTSVTGSPSTVQTVVSQVQYDKLLRENEELRKKLKENNDKLLEQENCILQLKEQLKEAVEEQSNDWNCKKDGTTTLNNKKNPNSK